MSRFDLGRQQLAAILSDGPSYRVDQLWDGIHRDLREPAELTTLPKSLRTRLALCPELARAWSVASESTTDGGATCKWVLQASDGSRVETVLMRYRDRTTVCVSSQAGCAMGCSFCATGQLGFGRQLTSGEIVEQVVLAARKAAEAGWGRIANLVFMGMGEPLANYEHVFAAVRRCNQSLGIGARSITVSTVGVIPGIRKMSRDPLQVNLAVSLHAANDDLRDRLVPLNRRYPLGALMEACREYGAATRRRISFEWACIAGVNDSARDATQLARLAVSLRAHVNLIPLNPTPGYKVAGSTKEVVLAFCNELRVLGVTATVRNTRGRDLDAACGQLAAGLEIGALRRATSDSAGPRRVAVAAHLA
ncbi:MAG: 23S rRNA (adenine(2503)-C(2))-methyltransferase RlmN [Acidimicrobiales bacterium]